MMSNSTSETKTPYRLIVSVDDEEKKNLDIFDFILEVLRKKLDPNSKEYAEIADRSTAINKMIEREIKKYPDIVKIYNKIDVNKLN